MACCSTQIHPSGYSLLLLSCGVCTVHRIVASSLWVSQNIWSRYLDAVGPCSFSSFPAKALVGRVISELQTMAQWTEQTSRLWMRDCENFPSCYTWTIISVFLFVSKRVKCFWYPEKFSTKGYELLNYGEWSTLRGPILEAQRRKKKKKEEAKISLLGENSPLSELDFNAAIKGREFCRRGWLKNHVLPIAATVTPTLPARFLCRTAKTRGTKSRRMLNRY